MESLHLTRAWARVDVTVRLGDADLALGNLLALSRQLREGALGREDVVAVEVSLLAVLLEGELRLERFGLALNDVDLELAVGVELVDRGLDLLGGAGDGGHDLVVARLGLLLLRLRGLIGLRSADNRVVGRGGSTGERTLH